MFQVKSGLKCLCCSLNTYRARARCHPWPRTPARRVLPPRRPGLGLGSFVAFGGGAAALSQPRFPRAPACSPWTLKVSSYTCVKERLKRRSMQVKESSRLTLLQQGQLLRKVLASSRTLHQVEQDNISLAQAFPGHPPPPGYAEGPLHVGWEDEDEAGRPPTNRCGMRGSPGPAARTQTCQTSMSSSASGKRQANVSATLESPCIQRRGKDLEQGALAPLCVPCRWAPPHPVTAVHRLGGRGGERAKPTPASSPPALQPSAMAQPSGKAVREPGSCLHREHSASRTAKRKTPPLARKARKPHPTISRSPRIFSKKCFFRTPATRSSPACRASRPAGRKPGRGGRDAGPPACRT